MHYIYIVFSITNVQVDIHFVKLFVTPFLTLVFHFKFVPHTTTVYLNFIVYM
jgi:hypothetical protein